MTTRGNNSAHDCLFVWYNMSTRPHKAGLLLPVNGLTVESFKPLRCKNLTSSLLEMLQWRTDRALTSALPPPRVQSESGWVIIRPMGGVGWCHGRRGLRRVLECCLSGNVFHFQSLFFFSAVLLTRLSLSCAATQSSHSSGSTGSHTHSHVEPLDS